MSSVVFASAIYKILIKTQCLKNNLNFRIKTEPVTAGAYASVSICFYAEIQIIFGTVQLGSCSLQKNTKF